MRIPMAVDGFCGLAQTGGFYPEHTDISAQNPVKSQAIRLLAKAPKLLA